MGFGTFLVGLRSYPRVRPHDLGIQIDITTVEAFFLSGGPEEMVSWGDPTLAKSSWGRIEGRIEAHFLLQVGDLDKVRPGSCRKRRCAPFGTTP